VTVLLCRFVASVFTPTVFLPHPHNFPVLKADLNLGKPQERRRRSRRAEEEDPLPPITVAQGISLFARTYSAALLRSRRPLSCWNCFVGPAAADLGFHSRRLSPRSAPVTRCRHFRDHPRR
jgi:hypothetical protein